MKAITATDLALSVKLDRNVRKGPMTLFAVMRNEMYFLPAFFEHYRKLGVEQFVIVDDASDDGTSDYLASQPDCCSGKTHIRFGEHVTITDASYSGLSGRAGPILKHVLPDHYLRGQHVLIVDADEFLLLPETLPRVPDVVQLMKDREWKSVASSLIDFYPESLAGLENPDTPLGVADLFAKFGFFDAVPFMTLPAGRQPRKTGQTASERLFRTCGIQGIPPAFDVLPRWLAGVFPWPSPRAAWFKTPIIYYDGSTHIVGSHAANVPPPPDIMLAMAHFKFNGVIYQKIRSAIRLKSHARKGQKYQHYDEMLIEMQRRKLGFLGPDSQLYIGTDQLVSTGLMVLPE